MTRFSGMAPMALAAPRAPAAAYSLGSYVHVVWVDIGSMIPFHGAVNALGFALAGLLARNLDLPRRPPPIDEERAAPLSAQTSYS